MDSSNFLHKKLPDLQKSPEVTDAIEKNSRLTGEKSPSTAEGKLDVYLDRLENVFLNEDEDVRKRNIEMLRDKIYDAYIIKHDDVPESYFDLQKRVARERGQHVEEIDGSTREQMISVIIEDQKKSLDSWIDYLSSDDAMYPTWFKYFVFRNITKLSQFDKELGKFKERTKATTAPFPDIYREALAKVSDMYEGASRDKALFKDKDFQNFLSKKFPVQYADAIQKTLERTQEGREQIKGEWVKYKQGGEEEAKKLYSSLENKGTGWCTAGYSTARVQIERGDFYVYYTYDSDGLPNDPRLAIRMDGTDKIGEVRGVLPHQEVEPLLQEILDAKLSEFGSEADKYKKNSENMKRLTAIEKASQKGKELTKDDLHFLYEIDTKIEGFGYEEDPRIEEIRNKRNRQQDIAVIYNCSIGQVVSRPQDVTESTRVLYLLNSKDEDSMVIFDLYDKKNKKEFDDTKRVNLLEKVINIGGILTPEDLRFLYEIDIEIQRFGSDRDPRIEKLKKKRNMNEDVGIMYNCDPKHVINKFLDITEGTQLFYQSKGKDIKVFDFREEKNKEKLPKLIELAKSVRETGNFARPDMDFEGGIVSVEIDKEKLKDFPTALRAYKEADNGSPSWVWEEWLSLEPKDFIVPEKKLDIFIISYDSGLDSVDLSLEKISKDIEKINLRPVTISELIALGIAKPEFNKGKEDMSLIALGTKVFLEDYIRIPRLDFNDGERRLNRLTYSSSLNKNQFRVICVPK